MSTDEYPTVARLIAAEVRDAVSRGSRRSRREAILVLGLGAAILAILVLALVLLAMQW